MEMKISKRAEQALAEHYLRVEVRRFRTKTVCGEYVRANKEVRVCGVCKRVGVTASEDEEHIFFACTEGQKERALCFLNIVLALAGHEVIAADGAWEFEVDAVISPWFVPLLYRTKRNHRAETSIQ